MEKVKRIKRETYFIGLAVILIILAVYLFLNDKSYTLPVESKAFAIKDTSEVTGICIQKGKDSLYFERHGNYWVINHTYNVKKRAMKALLEALMNFEVDAPAPKNDTKKILDTIKTNALLVTISHANESILKYAVCNGIGLNHGSFMLLDGQKQPYQVHLPGFDGDLMVLLNSNPAIWRDHVVFRYQEGDIQNVEIKYYNNENTSFVLDASNKQKPIVQSLALKQKISIRQEIADQYLSNFSVVPFEWIKSPNIQILTDSLHQVTPFCNIRIRDRYNHLNIISLYRIPDAHILGKFNPFKLYGIQQNDNIPLIVKYTDMDPILKIYNDFLRE